MKYRGVFDIDERVAGKIYYSQDAGKFGSLKNVLQTYISRHLKKK